MFQFIRAEVYARRASTNEKSKSIYNISDILGEALRDENHIPHVDNPKEPRYIIGSEVDIRAIPIVGRKCRTLQRPCRSKDAGRCCTFASRGSKLSEGIG